MPQSTLSRRISEFLGVALFALALIWLISLVTYEPSDPVWFFTTGAVIAECIEASGVEERADQGLMTEKLRVELRRFFKKRSGRRPLVLPVLMEI